MWTEHLAARITGALLFAVAAYVALIATLALLGHREVRPSFLGIVVLIVAAVVMPPARTAEAPAVRLECQCSTESRCCGVRPLWLLVDHRTRGPGCECLLGNHLGRSCGCSVPDTASYERGLAGSQRKAVRLPLIVPGGAPTWRMRARVCGLPLFSTERTSHGVSTAPTAGSRAVHASLRTCSFRLLLHQFGFGL